MSLPNILILEENDLTAMTLASIKQYAPDASVTVVSSHGAGSRFRAALLATKPSHSSKNLPRHLTKADVSSNNYPTLCMVSGAILSAQIINIPPMATLIQYSICLSRQYVFVDHPAHSHIYGLMGVPANKSVMDSSVFVINPSEWGAIPRSDAGILGDIKRITMPRVMNHKADVGIKAVSAWGALQYGMLGHGAAVNNYVDHYLRGQATPNEMYAYPLELALPHIEDLAPQFKDRIWRLGKRANVVAGKLRHGLQNFFK